MNVFEFVLLRVGLQYLCLHAMSFVCITLFTDYINCVCNYMKYRTIACKYLVYYIAILCCVHLCARTMIE